MEFWYEKNMFACTKKQLCIWCEIRQSIRHINYMGYGRRMWAPIARRFAFSVRMGCFFAWIMIINHINLTYRQDSNIFRSNGLKYTFFSWRSVFLAGIIVLAIHVPLPYPLSLSLSLSLSFSTSLSIHTSLPCFTILLLLLFLRKISRMLT